MDYIPVWLVIHGTNSESAAENDQIFLIKTST